MTMPIHDWARVKAWYFHDFHHGWISEIKRALNAGILPDEYYALAEQQSGAFGPDVLTLQGFADEPEDDPNDNDSPASTQSSNSGLLLAPPKTRLVGESDMAFYRNKKKSVVVRHVSRDQVVAVVEIVSPGNKSSRNPFRAFVEKACELLDHRIHLLIIDLLPPGPRDPQGIHDAIWEEMESEEYTLPDDENLTLASYESELTVRAYVEHVAVGDALPDMPLFLEPGAHVLVPLETTYEAAFNAVPRRWRSVLEKQAVS